MKKRALLATIRPTGVATNDDENKIAVPDSKTPEGKSKIAPFCLSGAIYYHGFTSKHDFLRPRLKQLGFNIKKDCNPTIHSVLVGDGKHAETYSGHTKHLTVAEFLALQAQPHLMGIHKVFEQAKNHVERNHKAGIAAAAKTKKKTSATKSTLSAKKKNSSVASRKKSVSGKNESDSSSDDGSSSDSSMDDSDSDSEEDYNSDSSMDDDEDDHRHKNSSWVF